MNLKNFKQYWPEVLALGPFFIGWVYPILTRSSDDKLFIFSAQAMIGSIAIYLLWVLRGLAGIFFDVGSGNLLNSLLAFSYLLWIAINLYAYKQDIVFNFTNRYLP
ncbi:MAG: hypothetical protein D6767_04190 [Candidatus Hydrogenedentota bacterium]|nr:MAG: hypothetical protein D6767_04190 [Candidatus Hydrogenedentota bacterium]